MLTPVEVTNTGTLEVIVNVDPPDVVVSVSELYEVIVVVKGIRRSVIVNVEPSDIVVSVSERSELEAELTAARWIPEVMSSELALRLSVLDAMDVISTDEETRAPLPLDPELSKADDCPPPDPFELPATEPTE